MGQGIAQMAAAAGHPVLLYDASEAAAQRAIENISAQTAKLVEKGKLQPQEQQAMLSRIRRVDHIANLSAAALAVEAIVEDMAAKVELLQAVEGVVAESAILATNTSSLSVTELGSRLVRPGQFAGLHFFNPAPVMPLVEVVGGLRTSDATLANLSELMSGWGKEPVVLKNSPGFLVNRGARPFYSEPLKFAEEEGADIPTIDAIFRGNGFKMGPLELIDLIGLDVNLNASRAMWQAYYAEPRYRPSRLIEERVAAGFLGKKSGRGLYDYESGKAPESKFMLGAPAPREVIFYGDLGPAASMFELCRARGLEVDRSQGEPAVMVDRVKLGLTDGSLACDRGPGWVTFDLCLDWSAEGAIALTSPDPAALVKAAGFFQSLGKTVVAVNDLPGMLIARTVCMLINEACDTVLSGVAGEAEVDLAMQKGLNFPGAPFQWLRSLGPAYVENFLDNMAWAYGDPRYRASIYLRRLVRHGRAVSNHE